MKERKPVIAWIFFGFCIFWALIFLLCESIPGFLLMLLVAVAAMPVQVIRNLWENVFKNKFRGMKKTAILAAVFVLAFLVGAATITSDTSSENGDIYNSSSAGNYVDTVLGAENSDTEGDTKSDDGASGESSKEQTGAAETTVLETTTEASATEKQTKAESTAKTAADSTAFSVGSVPDYSGDAYVAVNGNIPYFSEGDYTTEAFEIYSDLDSLGRCGVAYANICPELMPTQDRESISSVTPTGWVNNSYSFVDGGYVYNRCHLIGFQLAGENANEKNLITGTRYLNIDGMLPFENMVNDYVDETENHVLYRVTPIFEGNNLVASGVLMEGWSVEDDGDGICFCVYAYNVQPGVTIDYATGENEASGEYATDEATTIKKMETATTEKTETATTKKTETTTTEKTETATTKKTETTTTEKTENTTTEAATEAETEAEGSGITYILNTSTHKFHYPDCYSAARIADKNRAEYTGDREDLIAQGYQPCKNCNP